MITHPGKDANALLAYETHFALKEYFKDGSKYDYFRYKGKILGKAAREKFISSRWYFSSIKVWNTFKSVAEIEKAIVANIIAGEGSYIGNINFELYTDLLKKYDQLLYVFDQDLRVIFGTKTFETTAEYFKGTVDYPYSFIFDMYMNDKIQIETVIVLNSITHFLIRIHNANGDFVFEEDLAKIMKYKNFFSMWQKNTLSDYKKTFASVIREC